MPEKKVLTSLGSKIRELRMEKGYSQIQLATLCNFEKASMSRIESGKTNITILTLFKISKALNRPVADFFASVNELQEA